MGVFWYSAWCGDFSDAEDVIRIEGGNDKKTVFENAQKMADKTGRTATVEAISVSETGDPVTKYYRLSPTIS